MPISRLLARTLLILPIIFSVLLLPLAHASKSTAGHVNLRDQADRALRLVELGDLRGADRELSLALEHPGFNRLPARRRHALLSASARAALEVDDQSRAADRLRDAIAVNPKHSRDWFLLFQLERTLGHSEASAARLAHFARTWPDETIQLDPYQVFPLLAEDVLPTAARFDLLQALFRSDWDQVEAGASSAWLQLATLHLEHGDHAKAEAAIKRIRRPEELLTVRIDKRFDPIAARDRHRQDMTVATRAYIDWLNALAAWGRPPERTTINLSYALLTAGLDQEAVRLSDRILAADGKATADGLPATPARNLIWIRNNRSIALRRLGRLDEALADLVGASSADESGGGNVSQVINLAELYCHIGRPTQTLATLARVGEMSPYGRMMKASAEHCAYALLDDADGMRTALDYLHDHRDDGPAAYLEALLREGQLDRAATELSHWLTPPSTRTEALLWVQDYRSYDPLPGEIALRRHRDALFERDDVNEAIERVGRRERHAITSI